MTSLPQLTLPPVDARLGQADGRRTILCSIRRKHVALTPEEWVRQHVLGYLTQRRGYPASLIAVERGFRYQNMPWRADVVAYDRSGRPTLLVECKAPDVPIRRDVFEQASRYNLVVGAEHVAVSNGVEHYCFFANRAAGTIEFLSDIPLFHGVEAT